MECIEDFPNDAESRFRINIFYGCLDIILSKLVERFRGLNEVADSFGFLQPQTLGTISDELMFERCENLVKKYRGDLSDQLPIQMISFRSCLRSEILKLQTVRDVANLFLINNPALTTSFPDICTLFFLFITIPVTVASAERSFSKLKIIKTYLRSMMGQDRLSGLSILSIENEIACRIRHKTDHIVKVFAEQKARKHFMSNCQ